MPSTPHLTEDARAALLDPDGGGDLGDMAREHLVSCAECRAIVEADVAADQQAHKLLQMLDHPMLHIDFEQVKAIAVAFNRDEQEPPVRLASDGVIAMDGVMSPRIAGPARAGIRAGVRVDVRDRATSRSAPRVMTRLDAGANRVWRWGWRGIGVVAFGTGAAAAALVPDSVAHRFVARVMDRMVASITHKSSVPPAVVPETPPPGSRGVSIVPSGPVTISFQTARPAGMIHVLYGSSSHVTVRASAEGASYAVGPDGVHVDNSGAESLTYTVELPPLEQSPPVKIVVGSTVLYSAANGRVDVPETTHPEASYELPLASH